MNCVHKFSGLIVTSFGTQIKKMFSNIAKPLGGKVAIITASTDG